MINILLVDDNDVVRESIAALLKLNEKFNIVGECNDGSTVLPFLEKGNVVDLILMDVSMVKIGGVEATSMVLKKYPEMKILALTMHSQNSYVDNMKEIGAMGYILKTAEIDDIYNAIYSAVKGIKTFDFAS